MATVPNWTICPLDLSLFLKLRCRATFLVLNASAKTLEHLQQSWTRRLIVLQVSLPQADLPVLEELSRPSLLDRHFEGDIYRGHSSI